jgi:copper(I)-binding protein
MKFIVLCGALLLSFPSYGQISIENAWARATAPGAKVGGGYLTIRNRGSAPDRLVGASSPAAARVELHEHVREGEVMKMREVKGFGVPANGAFELKPGGAHLMFMDIRQPFKEGEKLPVRLIFDKAGEVKAEFHVGRLGDTKPPAHRH